MAEKAENKARKRKRTNRKNLAYFFSLSTCHCVKWSLATTTACAVLQGAGLQKDLMMCPDHPGYRHMKIFSPEEMLQILHMWSRDPAAFERVVAYANRFKQAVNEIDADDIRAAADELTVREIMDR